MATKSKTRSQAKKKPAVKAPVTRKRIVKKPLNNKAAILASNPPEKEWEAFFILAEHWQTDLKFYADESQFLRSLIDKYFMWLIDEKYIEETRKMASKLMKLSERRSLVEQNVAEHLKHLGNLIQNPFPYDAQAYRDEHARLESSLADFLKEFRIIKKEIFLLTEQVIGSEKVKHLLGQ